MRKNLDRGAILRHLCRLYGRGLAVSAVAVAALVGCANTEESGGSGAPLAPGYVPPTPDSFCENSWAVCPDAAESDTDAKVGADGSEADGAAAGADGLLADGAQSDEGGADAAADGAGGAEDTLAEPSPIGGPCSTAADCAHAGAVCTEWPAGKSVCTVLDCADAGCPDGAACVQFDDQTWGCAPICEDSTTCRPGYFCKSVLSEAAPELRVCHAVELAAGGPAAFCTSHMNCQKELSCLADSFPKGYCAQAPCGPSAPCPGGTACVQIEPELSACLRVCDASKPCPGALAKLQECVELETTSGTLASVCAKGQTGKGLGEFCADADECLSGECLFLGDGICLGSGLPCASAADCDLGDTCLAQGGSGASACGKTCSADSPCPEETVCVPIGPTTGTCRRGCKGLADVLTCKAAQGERCLYGLPLGAPVGEGAYACARVPEGAAGAPCLPENASPCAAGLVCVGGGAGAQGMCVSTCGSTTPDGLQYCPWTTACASTGVTSGCIKLCPEQQKNCIPGFACECPSDFQCQVLQFAAPFVGEFCVQKP
jgi:hypothetical protein